jgi:hypothetical protein
MVEISPKILVLASPLCLATCVPDLQAGIVCLPDRTVAYSDAPAETLKAETQQAIEAYVGLAGLWSAELGPENCPNAGPVTVSLRPVPLEAVKVVVGVQEDSSGVDCHRQGTASAGGQISLSGDTLGKLSGENAELRATFNKVGMVHFDFDPAYDPTLQSVGGLMIVRPEGAVETTIQFAKVPVRTGDGVMSQTGYDCNLALLTRL